MMKLVPTLLCLLLCACAASSWARIHHRRSSFASQLEAAKSFDGKIWAVLVAGSNGYDNYRHQADVCHAYQVLRSHGIPDERIVVMMYDDIANNRENPTPGVIMNRPNGPDVYKGVPKDYTGAHVTPENFLKVLQGDAGLAAAGNKVIGSNDKDHIFVYFSDHGAPGLVAFPSEVLYAKDLSKALEQMHEADRFQRMVIYIEACESGSMFKGLLPKHNRIYAVTASNEEEPSWGYYCDSGTCLGDEFSVKWLEDSDSAGDLNKETLSEQYQRVKKAVTHSHVSHYGDLTFNGTTVGEFQGEKAAEPTLFEASNSVLRVASYDVPIFQAEARVQRSYSLLDMHKLNAMKAGREFVDTVTEELASAMEEAHGLPHFLMGIMEPLERHDCYKVLVDAFIGNCFDVSRHTYALRSLFVFVNACQGLPDDESSTVETVADTIASFCKREVGNHPFAAIV